MHINPNVTPNVLKRIENNCKQYHKRSENDHQEMHNMKYKMATSPSNMEIIKRNNTNTSRWKITLKTSRVTAVKHLLTTKLHDLNTSLLLPGLEFVIL